MFLLISVLVIYFFLDYLWKRIEAIEEKIQSNQICTPPIVHDNPKTLPVVPTSTLYTFDKHDVSSPIIASQKYESTTFATSDVFVASIETATKEYVSLNTFAFNNHSSSDLRDTQKYTGDIVHATEKYATSIGLAINSYVDSFQLQTLKSSYEAQGYYISPTRNPIEKFIFAATKNPPVPAKVAAFTSDNPTKLVGVTTKNPTAVFPSKHTAVVSTNSAIAVPTVSISVGLADSTIVTPKKSIDVPKNLNMLKEIISATPKKSKTSTTAVVPKIPVSTAIKTSTLVVSKDFGSVATKESAAATKPPVKSTTVVIGDAISGVHDKTSYVNTSVCPENVAFAAPDESMVVAPEKFISVKPEKSISAPKKTVSTTNKTSAFITTKASITTTTKESIPFTPSMTVTLVKSTPVCQGRKGISAIPEIIKPIASKDFVSTATKSCISTTAKLCISTAAKLCISTAAKSRVSIAPIKSANVAPLVSKSMAFTEATPASLKKSDATTVTDKSLSVTTVGSISVILHKPVLSISKDLDDTDIEAYTSSKSEQPTLSGEVKHPLFDTVSENLTNTNSGNPKAPFLHDQKQPVKFTPNQSDVSTIKSHNTKSISISTSIRLIGVSIRSFSAPSIVNGYTGRENLVASFIKEPTTTCTTRMSRLKQSVVSTENMSNVAKQSDPSPGLTMSKLDTPTKLSPDKKVVYNSNNVKTSGFKTTPKPAVTLKSTTSKNSNTPIDSVSNFSTKDEDSPTSAQSLKANQVSRKTSKTATRLKSSNQNIPTPKTSAEKKSGLNLPRSFLMGYEFMVATTLVLNKQYVDKLPKTVTPFHHKKLTSTAAVNKQHIDDLPKSTQPPLSKTRPEKIDSIVVPPIDKSKENRPIQDTWNPKPLLCDPFEPFQLLPVEKSPCLTSEKEDLQSWVQVTGRRSPRQKPSASRTKTGRCSEWPKCSNRSCQYSHPLKACRYDPNCKFGNQCSFLHSKDYIQHNIIRSPTKIL